MIMGGRYFKGVLENCTVKQFCFYSCVTSVVFLCLFSIKFLESRNLTKSSRNYTKTQTDSSISNKNTSLQSQSFDYKTGHGNFTYISSDSYDSHTFYNNVRIKDSNLRRRLITKVASMTRGTLSWTNPPFYPRGGTGRSVSIAHDFNSSIINLFCQGIDLHVIIPVYSAAANIERREAIRGTMAKMCARISMGCKLFFVVGVSLQKEIYQRVKQEYVDRKDILMVNKLETYRDLNNKAVAMLDWIINHCPTPKYVLHTIDDVFLNIEMFLGELGSLKDTSYILGVRPSAALPVRRKNTKWYVSFHEYPYYTYPMYAVGTAYAFPTSVSKALRSAINTAEYCWIEDVWMTGLVRIKADVKLILTDQPSSDIPDRQLQPSQTLYMHQVTIQDFYYFYNKSKTNN